MRLLVNGKAHELEAAPDELLLWVLRDKIGLTGTKFGCGEGECGACTVLVNGRPVRSCQVPAAAAAGKPITTIEGLERNGRLHPVQAAFLRHEAFQCAYCASGMIMSAAGLLARNPKPSERQIRAAMNGNLCRCGTYSRILKAVRAAALASRKRA